MFGDSIGNGLRISTGLTTFSYVYDDQGHLTAILRDDVLVEERRNDAAGQMVYRGDGGKLSDEQIAQLDAGVPQSDQAPDTQTRNSYDKNGQLRHVESVRSCVDKCSAMRKQSSRNR